MDAGVIQNQQFQERLKRVKAGGANTTRQIYAGTVEPKRKHKRYETREAHYSVEKSAPGILFLPVYLVTGLLIGAAAVVIARYLRFKLELGAITGANADLLMLGDIVLAITIAIILKVVFRFKSKLHGFAKILGVTAAVLLMHNVVHIAPAPFERAFSVQWVNHVVQTTKPNSLLIAGYSYDFTLQALTKPQGANRQR